MQQHAGAFGWGMPPGWVGNVRCFARIPYGQRYYGRKRQARHMTDNIRQPNADPGPDYEGGAQREGRGTNRGFWVLLVVGLGVIAVLNWPTKPPEGWEDNYQTALTKATDLGKPILVAFYLENCPPCKRMERTTLRDATVVKEVEHFVPVRVDMLEEADLSTRLGVNATPTYYVLDHTGAPLGRALGYLEPDRFISFLREARLRGQTN